MNQLEFLLDTFLMDRKQLMATGLATDAISVLESAAAAIKHSELASPKPRNPRHPESRALASNIPNVPVAVSAAQLASERQRRVPPRSTGKGRPALAARARPEVIPSVEALRSRWLAGS